MKILVNSVVELTTEAESLYQKASAPARAIVKQTQIDEYGFDKVYVEWDRDHWRHNGESDKWAYASHFNVVKYPIPEDEDEEGYFEDFFIPDESDSKLQSAIESAALIASTGEGFMLISLERDQKGDLYPKIVMGSSSDEAETVFSEEILPLLGFDYDD
jgi:hypothetical protein